MMIGARTAAWAKSAIPYDREVKSLIGDGLAWIDSGVVFDTATDATIEFVGNFVEIPVAFARIGLAGGFDAGHRRNNEWYNGYSTDGVVGVDIQTSVKIEFSLSFSGDKVLTAFENENGQVVATQPTLNVSTSLSYPLFRFGVSTIQRFVYQYLKITFGGVLIRDFVPVVKGDEGFMFDRCGSICPITGNSLYANSGSGAFTWEEI